MSYISPNSDVRLLKNIPFDRSYNHTKNFWGSDYLNEQANYFMGFTKNLNGVTYAYSSQSYQRVNKNTIRLAVLADNIYDCNYMMFRNTAYGNKWFYAFIDSINYINDNCTEISYTIDVLQTWFFDYDIRACFVEREHAITDNIGDNLVPENLETGDHEAFDVGYERFQYFLGAIVTSKKIPDVFLVSSNIFPLNSQYRVDTQFTPERYLGQGTDTPNGIPNGLYIAYGFPISDRDVTSYWDAYIDYNGNTVQRSSIYNMQTYAQQGGSVDSGPLTIGRLLSYIGYGSVPAVTGGNLSIDDVVCVYMYPADMNLKTNMQLALNSGYRNGTAMYSFFQGGRPVGFKELGSNDVFYPKNNKLFTYPYVYLNVSNNTGQVNTYKYEELGGFYDNGVFRPLFRWIGNFLNAPTVALVPNYNGIQINFDEALNIGDFPSPTYQGSQLAKWLESNQNKWAFGLISSTISNLGFALRPMAPEGTNSLGHPNAGAGVSDMFGRYAAIGNIAKEVGSSIAMQTDLAKAPPSVAGNFSSDALTISTDRVGFRFYSMAIKRQFAEIIDDYFTMYGYATKRCKIPNVMHKEIGEKIRNNFMYTKTVGAIVTPKIGAGLPAEDIEEIQRIFDKGVTFWRNDTVCGDYTVNNDIITIS